MQKTGIEYLDFTYNIVKGRCPNTDCPIFSDCYMKRAPSCWAVEKNPALHLDTKTLFQKFPDEPSIIGVGYNIELFHEKIPSAYIEAGLKEIRERGQNHTWLFLTKCPARYAEFDFPKNCWLGVTATHRKEIPLGRWMGKQNHRNTLFLSLEPLFERPALPLWADWIIVGAITGKSSKEYQPLREWIESIVRLCRDHSKPIFLKNNLRSIWGNRLIQEFPQT